MRRERLEAAKKLGIISASIQASANEFLNKQIYIVLTTKYKKEAKEAFQYVEASGYITYKNGHGTWTVENPHTKKWVCASELKNSWKRGSHREFYYSDKRCTLTDKIDFANCLKTPTNRVWQDIKWVPWDSVSPAVKVYEDKIRFPKRMAKSYAEDIEAYQKQIEELQAKIVRAARCKAEYEMKVQMAKKELGV